MPIGVAVCAALGFTIGASVLLGWVLDVPVLVTWFPGHVTIKANTALCLVATAAALFLNQRAQRMGQLGVACTAVVVFIAGITLAQYAFGWRLGIDQLLVVELSPGSGTSHAGRMAPNTALELVLLGAALYAARQKSEVFLKIAQACTFGALFLVMVALVGYVYGANVLVGLFSQTRMAIPTIVGMLALGVGTLWVTAEGGWLQELTRRGSGNVVARRLLPAALLLPLSIGIVTLSGYRAGLYDPAFGVAVMAVAETVSFSILVWLCARSLNENERGRRLASEDELTGLLNRRGFLFQAEALRASARRVGEDALLLFIDVDGMKGINDNLGHAAGDRALIETAGVLRSTFREGDALGRMGGDEFAVFASKATMESAPWMLSRLELHRARLSDAPGRDFELRLSTGVTAWIAKEDSSIAELLERADARMYEQKEATRRSESGKFLLCARWTERDRRCRV